MPGLPVQEDLGEALEVELEQGGSLELPDRRHHPDRIVLRKAWMVDKKEARGIKNGCVWARLPAALTKHKGMQTTCKRV